MLSKGEELPPRECRGVSTQVPGPQGGGLHPVYTHRAPLCPGPTHSLSGSRGG